MKTANIWLTEAIQDLDLMAKVTASWTFCQPIFKKIGKKFDEGKSRQ